MLKKWKIDRIISILTLVTSVIAVYLVIKKPQPVAPPQSPAMVAENAKSFEEKIEQLEKPKDPDAQPAEVHITSNEASAAFVQSAGTIPAQQFTPNTELGSMPSILDQQVSFDGDQAHGQFRTTIAGKSVWITVSGRLGSKDGYATFQPTEFKFGDMSIPVSLVNGALQKKMAEQHEQFKLPDSIGGIKIENGELVVTQK